jgi:hypothetical protein
MSGDAPSLVVTYTLNRDEDPLLFDHLAAFRKGRPRRARLGTLISMGFEHEKRELRERDRPVTARSASEPEGSAGLELLDDLIREGASVHGRS